MHALWGDQSACCRVYGSVALRGSVQHAGSLAACLLPVAATRCFQQCMAVQLDSLSSMQPSGDLELPAMSTESTSTNTTCLAMQPARNIPASQFGPRYWLPQAHCLATADTCLLKHARATIVGRTSLLPESLPLWPAYLLHHSPDNMHGLRLGCLCSYPPSLQECPIFQGLFAVTRRFYLLVSPPAQALMPDPGLSVSLRPGPALQLGRRCAQPLSPAGKLVMAHSEAWLVSSSAPGAAAYRGPAQPMFH